ncbi:MAG TPA: hypothetical protein VIR98_02820 [Candidatus Paceibacterota bacterium]
MDILDNFLKKISGVQSWRDVDTDIGITELDCAGNLGAKTGGQTVSKFLGSREGEDVRSSNNILARTDQEYVIVHGEYEGIWPHITPVHEKSQMSKKPLLRGFLLIY